MMRMFSWLTVLIAAVAPTAGVAAIVLRADPHGPFVQLFTSMLQGQWLLGVMLVVALAPWPALTLAAIERDRRRQSRGAGSGRSSA
jgi:predicted outer membrane lipoprotein